MDVYGFASTDRYAMRNELANLPYPYKVNYTISDSGIDAIINYVTTNGYTPKHPSFLAYVGKHTNLDAFNAKNLADEAAKYADATQIAADNLAIQFTKISGISNADSSALRIFAEHTMMAFHKAVQCAAKAARRAAEAAQHAVGPISKAYNRPFMPDISTPTDDNNAPDYVKFAHCSIRKAVQCATQRTNAAVYREFICTNLASEWAAAKRAAEAANKRAAEAADRRAANAAKAAKAVAD